MTRIFTTMAIVAAVITTLTFALGMAIGDATSAAAQSTVSQHMLSGLAAVLVTSLVHALVLTYFMGTGRWLEETTTAYKLGWEPYQESKRLKYRTILLMMVCFGMLLTTGALGAAADPASRIQFKEFLGVSGGTIHMTVALLTWGLNLLVHLYQYQVLSRNGDIINEVLAEVRRIRLENGLAV